MKLRADLYTKTQSRDLELENERLRAENRRLRAEVEFLRSNPSVARGLKGESLVANLISAKPTKRGASHDLESDGGRVRFEVKSSGLLNHMSGRPLKRWVWTKLFGELGQKSYDRLLLVGDTDARYRAAYADPRSPYVLFDLPYADAVKLAGGVKPGRSSRIDLTTNPTSVRSFRSSALFKYFQVTTAEFQRRYPDLQPASEQKPNAPNPPSRRQRSRFSTARRRSAYQQSHGAGS